MNRTIADFHKHMRVVHRDYESHPWEGKVTDVEESSGLILVRWYNPKTTEHHNGCYDPTDLLPNVRYGDDGDVLAMATVLGNRYKILESIHDNISEDSSDRERAGNKMFEVFHCAVEFCTYKEWDGFKREAFLILCGFSV